MKVCSRTRVSNNDPVGSEAYCRSKGSLILARSHSFVEIDHEIISTVILLPSTDSRRVIVSYKPKYVHKVLVLINRLVKLAQEKMWLGELTVLT